MNIQGALTENTECNSVSSPTTLSLQDFFCHEEKILYLCNLISCNRNIIIIYILKR